MKYEELIEEKRINEELDEQRNYRFNCMLSWRGESNVSSDANASKPSPVFFTRKAYFNTESSKELETTRNLKGQIDEKLISEVIREIDIIKYNKV